MLGLKLINASDWKSGKNNGTEKIGLVIRAPELFHAGFT